MDKLFEIILTSSITLIGGVLIFSITKLTEKLLFEPVFELNKIRGQISYTLMFNANKFGNSEVIDKKDMDIVSDELRLLASKLITQLSLIHGYWILRLLGLIISKKRIKNASEALIGLSNGMYKPRFDFIEKQKDKITLELKIK